MWKKNVVAGGTAFEEHAEHLHPTSKFCHQKVQVTPAIPCENSNGSDIVVKTSSSRCTEISQPQIWPMKLRIRGTFICSLTLVHIVYNTIEMQSYNVRNWSRKNAIVGGFEPLWPAGVGRPIRLALGHRKE